MSPDSTISTTSRTAPSRDSAAGSGRPGSPNEAAIDAICGHHARQLHVRTDAVLAAARLLICGMLAEHRLLVSLIADLALAPDPAHLSKENDLLLPALDQAGLSLTTTLDGMHEILGHRTASTAHDTCGCGCDHDASALRADPLQVSARPDEAADVLDVRVLPHGQRHEIIFARLDQLQPGQALVIVNDHDPKPLRYQTAAMWPDRFAWSYLQAGPQVWRVAISRVG